MKEGRLNKLNPEEYSLAGEVLGELDIHLAVQALLDGDSPGEIYLDDKNDPQSALAWTMNRFFLAGPSDNVDMILALKELFDKEIFPDGLDQGREGFTVFYTPEEWGSVIAEVILNGRYPIHDQRHYYRCRKLKRDWRDLMPQGYSLLEVDENLVESQRMENLEELIEEIHSECQSVPAFLENRFGYCMVHEDQLVTWCLSEYNTGGRCEVGIATQPEHRRKGLATAASLALVERALDQGYQEVGWHCYAGNEASIATALAAGFEKVCHYPAYRAMYAEASGLGVNGNLRFEREDYKEAVDWYLRAIAADGAPVWVYWNTACAYAYLDQKELTFKYLHQAVDQGFKDAEHMKISQHFEKWHGTEEWRALVGRFQK